MRELRETRPNSRVGCGWGHAWVHHGGAGAPLTASWDAIATGADILVHAKLADWIARAICSFRGHVVSRIYDLKVQCIATFCHTRRQS